MNVSQDRLYELLPYIYQLRDADQGKPLRELLRVIAEQVDVVKENIAQLYDNWFIETAEDWVVPYIGDLVRYEAVYEAGEPGEVSNQRASQRQRIMTPRADVANTIRYRRQRGTLAVLELLAQDVAGWPVLAVEFYPLVGLTQPIKHYHQARKYVTDLRLGRGRLVDVRQGDLLERIGQPFDQTAHLLDIRRIDSPLTAGRYNSTNVGLFVWRLKVEQIPQTEAALHDEKPNCFSFSILGNDVPLYLKPQPVTMPGDEFRLPLPIRRRAMERWQKEDKLKGIYGPEEGKSLAIWGVYEKFSTKPRRRGRTPTNPVTAPEIRLIKASQLQVADLSSWEYAPKPSWEDNLPKVMIDPELGRMVFPESTSEDERLVRVLVMYHYAQCAEIGGGTYERPISEPTPPVTFSTYDVMDGGELAERLRDLSLRKLKLNKWFAPDDVATLTDSKNDPTHKQAMLMIRMLNKLLDAGELLYEDSDNSALAGLELRDTSYHFWLKLIETESQDEGDIRLFNRLYLEDLLGQEAVAGRSARYVVRKGVEKTAGRDSETVYSSLREALNQWATDGPRTAVIEIADSAIYEENLREQPIELSEGQTLQVQAANKQRPVIIMLDTGYSQFDALTIRGAPKSRLTLEGLLIAGRSLLIEGETQAKKEEDAPNERAMSEINIRHCTLVPGWSFKPKAREECLPRYPEKYSLELRHTGARVTIEHSIVGSIRVIQDEIETDPILLNIRDSILDATNAQERALDNGDSRHAHAALLIERSTVIGKVQAYAISLAENSIFDGAVRIARRQIGCMRFCWYDPAVSRVPKRFNCQPDLAEVETAIKAKRSGEDSTLAQELERQRLRPRFSSKRYGRPNYCQLTMACAEEIKTGADDQSEMGVYHDLYQPQRATNLLTRLKAFVPAGVDAGIIYVN